MNYSFWWLLLGGTQPLERKANGQKWARQAQSTPEGSLGAFYRLT
jgi:hypothetical protein